MAVEVIAPPGTVRVDGFGIGASGPRYAGTYPAGLVLEAEIEPAARDRFLGWEIETTPPIAEPATTPTLRLTVWGPTRIEARFRE
jgi:hypothetical protein